jgi:hypothetical protein
MSKKEISKQHELNARTLKVGKQVRMKLHGN